MSGRAYVWRSLTERERNDLLAWRRTNRRPWHSPPHRPSAEGDRQFLITAACYEHRHHIGRSLQRMDAFSTELVSTLHVREQRLLGWCVLPNHYHALVETTDLLATIADLGRLHGRTSHAWNGEEGARGRRVFFRAADRRMRSGAHAWATMNYIHHNAVHHRYVARWTDWPWSSAAEYLLAAGAAEATRIWGAYPIDGYGHGWDAPEL